MKLEPSLQVRVMSEAAEVHCNLRGGWRAGMVKRWLRSWQRVKEHRRRAMAFVSLLPPLKEDRENFSEFVRPPCVLFLLLFISFLLSTRSFPGYSLLSLPIPSIFLIPFASSPFS
ncbi:hypothetical protein MLD38_037584 [Melastoma candidum]|uniref:Uncharacterized protein n=1 Tax=Melastoma candidum TaxID=119954 RepID=A0ACB9LPB6_9MYRT|nr:hypothetical protein MLD38_037584 [Melastoma candidum]